MEKKNRLSRELRSLCGHKGQKRRYKKTLSMSSTQVPIFIREPISKEYFFSGDFYHFIYF